MNKLNSCSIENKIQNSIEEALIKVGVEQGDIILAHSDSTVVREVTGLKWADALNLLKDCFLNVLGESGTLIVPTFNYDFCKSKPYSHERTRSQVGMFTNSVLFDKRSIRSFHPIYSFAAIGPKAKDIFSNISKSSFGDNSVFHKLHQINAKVVFFNSSFQECTFIHYIEQLIGVDYRYLKYFTGEVSINGSKYIDTFDFFVRYLNKSIEPNFNSLREYLTTHQRLNSAMLFDKYLVQMTTCTEIHDSIVNNITNNPYFLLKRPPLSH